MNKALIGWIFAIIVLFACFAVIAIGGIFGYSLNNSLTKTAAELATANQTITQKDSDIQKGKSELTKVNGLLQDAKDETAKIQTALDGLRTLVCASPAWSSINSGARLGDGSGNGNYSGQHFVLYGLDNEVWVVTTNMALNLSRECIVFNPSWKTID
jgi:hypothetical protein